MEFLTVQCLEVKDTFLIIVACSVVWWLQLTLVGVVCKVVMNRWTLFACVQNYLAVYTLADLLVVFLLCGVHLGVAASLSAAFDVVALYKTYED